MRVGDAYRWRWRSLTALAPRGVAEMAAGEARLQSEVAAAGYSYGAVLDRPTLTFGRVADVRGLSGEEEITRLDLDALLWAPD
mgnify:CR=1 FL=1